MHSVNCIKCGLFSLKSDPKRQVWSIASKGKTKIDLSNVTGIFSRLIKSIVAEELELIPISPLHSDKNKTLRKFFAGKFVRDPRSPIIYWYIDAERFERHQVSQFELVDFLYFISSKINKEELDKIVDEK